MNSIELAGKSVQYEVKRKKGVRSLRMEVHPDCTLSLTFPWYMSASNANSFIKEKEDWVLKTLKKFDASVRITIDEPFQVLRSRAQLLVRERLEYFNEQYQYSYNNITIRNNKSRWGSCSHNGNLSFSYKMAVLPDYIADYIVVHELCHLREFNHSKQFWQLVAQTIPNHKAIRKELKYLIIK